MESLSHHQLQITSIYNTFTCWDCLPLTFLISLHKIPSVIKTSFGWKYFSWTGRTYAHREEIMSLQAFMHKISTTSQVSGEVLGIIGRDPSVPKSNRSHVVIFRSFFNYFEAYSSDSSKMINIFFLEFWKIIRFYFSVNRLICIEQLVLAVHCCHRSSLAAWAECN